jgi:septum site-determining protein MinC
MVMNATSAVGFRAGQFTFPVLVIYATDMDAVSDEVGERVRQAPEFFANAPVVIDIQPVRDADDLELAVLVGVLRSHSLNPVAVRGCTREQQQSARNLELAPLAEHQAGSVAVAADAGPEPDTVPDPAEADEVEDYREDDGTLLIERPVRSGQRVYAHAGDLVVVTSAGAGSELMAHGNIHVYGALRGRAMAGIGGDERTRIFCRRMEAELVSIAGHYRVSENIPEQVRGRAVQVYLRGNRLVIEPLDA